MPSRSDMEPSVPTFHRDGGVASEYIRKLVAEGWSPIFSLAQGSVFHRTRGDVKVTLYARGDEELYVETYWDSDEYAVFRKEEDNV